MATKKAQVQPDRFDFGRGRYEYHAVSTAYVEELQVWRTCHVKRVECRWRQIGEHQDATSPEQADRNHAAVLATIRTERKG